jgi:SAM-dependent methyltransferase
VTDHLHDHFRHDAAVDWQQLKRRQLDWSPLADAWWRIAGAGPGTRIADVGCGTGVFAARYAALGADVTAIDAQVDALAHVPQDPRLRILAHDAERGPLPGAPYEILFLTDVLHHVGSPAALLQNLRASGQVLLLGELDPAGPGHEGLDPAERLAPGTAAAWMREVGWQPGPVLTGLPFEHYAILGQ